MNSKKIKDKKIPILNNYNVILTKEISQFLRKERKKIKFPLRDVVKHIGIDEGTLKTYELKLVKTIPKDIYQRLIDFYENFHQIEIPLTIQNSINTENPHINSKAKSKRSSKRIPFTEEMSLFLKNKRAEMKISLKDLSQKLKININSLKDYEGRVCKQISEKNYIDLVEFYNNKEKIHIQNKETSIPIEKEKFVPLEDNPNGRVRIKLTKKMASTLKEQRQKVNFSREDVQKKVGLNPGVLARYENRSVNSIPKDIYNNLNKLYKYIFKNKIVLLPKRHILLTEEMSTLLVEKRKKTLFSCKEVGKNIKIGEILLRKYELRKSTSILKTNYENLIKFYDNILKKKVKPEHLLNRIILNPKIANSLRKKREETMFTVEEVSLKTGISRAIIYKMENSDIKTITKENYEKLLAFYRQVKENGLEPKFWANRIHLTDEIRGFLRKERTKTGYSYKEIATLLDINPSSLSNYELGTLKTIPKDIYEKIIKLYEDFNNNKIKAKILEKRIPLTTKVSETLKRERMKTKHSIMNIVEQTGVSKTIIFKAENMKSHSISQKDYDSLMNTYKEIQENNIEPKSSKGRIPFTKEMALSLVTFREKLNYSTQKVADLTGIKRTTLINYESGKSKSITKIQFDKLENFYNSQNSNIKKIVINSMERVHLTPKMASSLKKEREKNNLSANRLAKSIGIACNLYRSYELMKVKTISKDIYVKIKDFYQNLDKNETIQKKATQMAKNPIKK